MIFMGKGTELNNINILTPPPSCNACCSKLLATFAYKFEEIISQNTIFSPMRRESRSLFERSSIIRTAREVLALFNYQTCKDLICNINTRLCEAKSKKGTCHLCPWQSIFFVTSFLTRTQHAITKN